MKKLALFMTLVMAMALAVPAYAGIDTDITGKVTGKVEYKNEEFTGTGSVEVNVGLSAGSEGATKAVLDISGWSASSGDAPFGGKNDDGNRPYVADSGALNLKVNSAYIETAGAWFKGAPETTTKIGLFEANFNDWVAAISGSTTDNSGEDKGGARGNQDAVEVAGLDLGVASLVGYVGWLDVDDTDKDAEARVTVLSGSATVDIVDVSGAFLTHNDLDAKTSFTDFAVEASAAPVEGVTVDFTYASDGQNEDSAYKINGELTTIPDVTVSGSFWNTGADFNPEYARWDEDGDDEGDALDWPSKFTTDQAGYEVSASTTQSGVELGLTYNNTTDAAGNNGTTTTTVTAGTTVSDVDLDAEIVSKSSETSPKFVLSAGKSFGDINGSYKLTREHDESITHEISADTTVDTPVADGVALSAKVKLPDGSDAQADLDASWTAPNGFGLGLHYANYAGGDYAEGFSARASIEVTF